MKKKDEHEHARHRGRPRTTRDPRAVTMSEDEVKKEVKDETHINIKVRDMVRER